MGKQGGQEGWKRLVLSMLRNSFAVHDGLLRPSTSHQVAADQNISTLLDACKVFLFGPCVDGSCEHPHGCNCEAEKSRRVGHDYRISMCYPEKLLCLAMIMHD